jgi:hypothetical protein
MEVRISPLTKLTNNALYAWRHTIGTAESYKTAYETATLKVIAPIGVAVCAGIQCIGKTRIHIVAPSVRGTLQIG